MLGKILIANRGEIACRIIRTAKRMGIQTVAVYSDIDKGSKHVEMADQAFHIGPNPSAQSYLNGSKILEIARDNNVQGIHPGFGFLSENCEFADNCESQGIKFIGPSSESIRKMGSKSESKIIMENANVPVVPGYHGDNQEPQFLLEEARKIRFPVMIKAVMGGGGKGMRIVKEENEFLESLESAKREALKSFKDDRVIIEKYIEVSKHIEIQVFGDHFKNYVYLFERDCSIQRRHQKILEEAPSNIGHDLRHLIGNSAVEAARAVDYYNAGTVEFIFDVLQGGYYFMEMNTRLQVEHPITEMITKQDLVEWQLLVASGKELPLKQEDLKIHGHSIEARIYSEEPYNAFLPANGSLKYLREPVTNENVRIESGVRQNDEISIFYDPMIAKLVVWGKNRDVAVRQLSDSLQNYKILGLPTNIKFLKECAQNQDFISGDYDTGFIGLHQDKLLEKVDNIQNLDILSSVLARVALEKQDSNQRAFFNFRMNFNLKKTYKLRVNASHLSEEYIDYSVNVEYLRNGNVNASVFKDDVLIKQFDNVSYTQSEGKQLTIDYENNLVKREFHFEDGNINIFDHNGDAINVTFMDTKMPATSAVENTQKGIKAPMPGTILKIFVQKGSQVKKNDTLCVLEAMKMEHQIKAGQDGVIKSVNFTDGTFIEHGSVILEYE